jgi:hypothetical protein
MWWRNKISTYFFGRVHHLPDVLQVFIDFHLVLNGHVFIIETLNPLEIVHSVFIYVVHWGSTLLDQAISLSKTSTTIYAAGSGAQYIVLVALDAAHIKRQSWWNTAVIFGAYASLLGIAVSSLCKAYHFCLNNF